MYKKIKRALAILLVTLCIQGPAIPAALAQPPTPTPTAPDKPITSPTTSKPLAGGSDILGWPLANKPASFLAGIRSDFGFRNVAVGTTYHFAFDLDAGKGTDVLAAADGEVTFAGCNDPIRAVVVWHQALGISTVYYHLSDTSAVTVGDKIYKGDKVGESGPDDTSSFGYHLDFRVVAARTPAGWSGNSCPVGDAAQYRNPAQYFASLDTGAADVTDANFKVRDGTSGGYKAPTFKTDSNGDKYVEIDENDIWVSLKVENNDKDTDDVVTKLRLNGGGDVELHHFDYHTGTSRVNSTMPVRLGANAATATDEGYVSAGNLGPGTPTQDTFYTKVAKNQVPTDDKIHKVTFVIKDAFGNISDQEKASLPVKRKGTYKVEVKPDQPKYICCASPTFTVEVRNPTTNNLVDIDDDKEAISAKFQGKDATLAKLSTGTYRATTTERMKDSGSYVLTVQIKKKQGGKSLGTGQGAATAERPPQEYYTDACGNRRPKKWNPETCQYETPPGNNPCQPDDTAAIGGPDSSGSGAIAAGTPSGGPASPSSVADLRGATVAVLQGAFADSLTRLLNQAGVQVEPVPADFSPTIALQYPALFIPSGALSGYAGSDLMAERLARYTEAGGTLVVFSQPRGREFALLPGGQVTGYGYDEDIHCVFRSVGISEFGAPLISQTEEILSINVDGYFTHTPPGATILLRRTVTGAPAMFSYSYGSGKVLVSSSYADMATDLGQGSPQEALLLRDLAAWSLGGGATPPQTQPGGSVTTTLRLTNPAPVAATRAVFEVIGPDGAYGTFEQAVDVPAAGTATLDLPQPVPTSYEGGDTPTPGLWRIQASLFDADGNQLALNPAAGTFAVTTRTGTPGGFRFSGEPYAITVTSAGEEYLPGSDATFTFHVFNYDSQPRTFHVTWGLPHHGLGWDQTLSQEITVAANSVGDFDYTLHGIRDLDRLRTILWLAGRRVAYGERGFWMVQPRVDLGLEPTRPAYAPNETPALTVNAYNLMGQAIPLTGTLEVAGAAGIVTTFPVQLDVPAGLRRSQTITLAAPLPYGSYGATLRLGTGGRQQFYASTTIRVPVPDLRMAVDRPASIDATTPLTLHLRNVGGVTTNGITVSALLYGPGGDLVWQDRQDVSLAAGAGLDHELHLPAATELGSYRLQTEATVGDRTFARYDAWLPADLRLTVDLDATSYRVRQTAHATVTVQNTGVWRLPVPLEVAMPADADGAFAPDPVTLDLAAGSLERTTYDVLLPTTLSAGSHDFVATAHLVHRDLAARNVITIAPARVEDRLGVTALHRGDALAVRLVNPGGVDTTAPFNATLMDTSGNVVAQAGDTVTLTAGDETGYAVTLAVPSGAADGAYRLIVDGVNQATGAPFTYYHDLTVDGLRGEITIAADQPAYLANQPINLSGTATATHGAIASGSIRLDVYGTDPTSDGGDAAECQPVLQRLLRAPTPAEAARLLAKHLAPLNPLKQKMAPAPKARPLMAGILSSHWVGDGEPVPNPWDNGDYTEQLYNQILNVAVARDSGRVSVGTTLGDPNTDTDDYQRLLYGHAYPGTSYTTVKLNGQNLYLDRDTTGALSMVERPHYDPVQQAVVTAYEYQGSVRIEQIVTLVRSGSGRSDVAKVAYHVTNFSGQPQDVGLRIMYDTQLGYNDGAPFRILGLGAITQETEFLGGDVPSRFLVVDNLTEPRIVAQGVVTAAEERTPDRLVFGNWGNLWGHQWEYNVNPSVSLTGDSAVAYYWNPTTLAPGASVDLATRYGASNVSFGSGQVSTVVNAPAELRTAADNPFTIWAFVRNNTYSTAHGVQSTINLPAGLDLSPGQSQTQTVGDLAAGADAQVNWVVRATGQPSGLLYYSVNTDSTDVTGSGVEGNVCVHSAVFASDRGLHVWSNRFDASTADTLPYSDVVPGLLPGKYYAVATLQAPTGQALASATAPFYVTADDTLLTLQTDRSLYRLGDPVSVSGQVTNRSSAAGAFDLLLQAGSANVLSERFNLAPGESHPFTAQVTASTAGVLVLQANAGSAHASERVRVATPQITYTIDAPPVVGHAPFGVDVHLANTGLLPGQAIVSVGGESRTFTLAPGEQTVDHRVFTATGDLTIPVLLTGDVSATQSLSIHLGEAAELTVHPAAEYLAGPVAVPYTLTNTGELPTALTARLTVDGQTVERSVNLSPGAVVEDTALFDLTPGDHLLTYETALGQGQVTLQVRSPQPQVALTGTLPEHPGPFALHLANVGSIPIVGGVLIATPWSDEHQELVLSPGTAVDVTGDLVSAGAPAPGTYPLHVDVLAGGSVLAQLYGTFTLHGPQLQLQVDPPATAGAGSDATFTAHLTNSGDMDADGAVTLDLPSITQQTQHVHLAPGASTSLTFTANLNPDLPSGAQDGTLVVGADRLPFQYQVTGYAGQATASLDAPYYNPGQTARLTLHAVTQAAPGGGAAVIARISGDGGLQLEQSFPAGQSPTLTFAIPAGTADQLLSFGLYLESGRSLFIDTLRVPVATGSVLLYPDQPVYRPGETVHLTVQARHAGQIHLDGPGITLDQSVPAGPSSFAFTLPSPMVRGSYPLHYSLDGEAHTYPLTVNAPAAQIPEIRLDGASYAPGDTLSATLSLVATAALPDATVQWWLDGGDGSTNQWPLALPPGPCRVTITQSLAGLTRAGEHTLHVRIVRGGLVLAEGAALFTIRGPVVLGVAPAQVYRENQAVQVDVALRGEGTGHLTLLVDGTAAAEQDVTLSGYQTLRLSVGALAAGRHSLTARLTAGGLVSEAGGAVTVVALPQVSIGLAGTSSSDWYNGDLHLSLTADAPDVTLYFRWDDGPATLWYGQPLPSPGDGEHTLAAWAVSGGVPGPVVTRTIRIDRTPPVVTITNPSATDYLHHIQLQPVVDARDAGSGLATGKRLLLDGQPLTGQTVMIDLFYLSLGNHTLRLEATDLAGNSAATEVTFRVVSSIASTGSDVRRSRFLGWIDNNLTRDALLVELAAAQLAVDHGQKRIAVTILQAFIQHVEAQRGRRINSQAADLLQADARYVISTLQ